MAFHLQKRARGLGHCPRHLFPRCLGSVWGSGSFGSNFFAMPIILAVGFGEQMMLVVLALTMVGC